jgi:hypothetical protein
MGSGDATANSYFNMGGVVFDKCQFYFGAVAMEMVIYNTGYVAGLWITAGCQFEGQGTGKAFVGYVGASSIAYQLHIDNVYMSGNGYDKHVDLEIADGGLWENIHITNNDLSNADSEFVHIHGAGSGFARVIHVSGNQLKTSDTAGVNQAILLEQCYQTSVDDNTWHGGSTRAYMVTANVGTYAINDNHAWGNATTAVVNVAGGSTVFQDNNTN